MPKAKRTYTEEQKQAMRERLATARAKKVELQKLGEIHPPLEGQTSLVEEAPTAPDAPEPKETTKNGGENTEELLRQAVEAIATLAKLQAQGITTAASGPQVSNGRMVGTLTKYSVNPADYPSPVERLKNEARLAPIAFPLNYDIDYKVSTTSYQNKDGINCVEPKFSLELRRIVRDDTTGEATGGRYVICRLAMHEDPQAALEIARNNGIDVNTMDEKAFLDEMRYIQMRDWLFESFFPPVSTAHSDRTEMVVGGKVVEFFTINDGAEQPVKLPFNELSKYR